MGGGGEGVEEGGRTGREDKECWWVKIDFLYFFFKKMDKKCGIGRMMLKQRRQRWKGMQHQLQQNYLRVN